MPGTVKSELLSNADRLCKCDSQEKVCWILHLLLDKSHFITAFYFQLFFSYNSFSQLLALFINLLRPPPAHCSVLKIFLPTLLSTIRKKQNTSALSLRKLSDVFCFVSLICICYLSVSSALPVRFPLRLSARPKLPVHLHPHRSV